MQLDTMNSYVRHRLEHWGDEFALARDCEYLGHQSKNLLYVLMQHHGMPGKATGYKPLEVNPEAMEIEDIVSDIARSDRAKSWVLRAYYCGRGRRKFERMETANLLLTNDGFPPMRQRAYLDCAADGTRMVGLKLGFRMAA